MFKNNALVPDQIQCSPTITLHRNFAEKWTFDILRNQLNEKRDLPILYLYMLIRNLALALLRCSPFNQASTRLTSL